MGIWIKAQGGGWLKLCDEIGVEKVRTANPPWQINTFFADRDYFTLGSYETKAQAEFVLGMIWNAIMWDKKVFEMPTVIDIRSMVD